MDARVLIQSVYPVTGIGVIVVGVVTAGVLRTGMKLTLNGRVMAVKSIESEHKQVSEAEERTSVGIVLSNADYKLLEAIMGREVDFSQKQHSARTKPTPEGILQGIIHIFKR